MIKGSCMENDYLSLISGNRKLLKQLIEKQVEYRDMVLQETGSDEDIYLHHLLMKIYCEIGSITEVLLRLRNSELNHQYRKRTVCHIEGGQICLK